MDAPDTIYLTRQEIEVREVYFTAGTRSSESDDIPYHRERTCVWSHGGCDVWETSCEQSFEFIDNGPQENSFKYCPYCGGTIEIKEADHDR